jgi:hypothetical protein
MVQRGRSEGVGGVRDRARHTRGDYGAAASFGEQRGRGSSRSSCAAQGSGREVVW